MLPIMWVGDASHFRLRNVSTSSDVDFASSHITSTEFDTARYHQNQHTFAHHKSQTERVVKRSHDQFHAIITIIQSCRPKHPAIS